MQFRVGLLSFILIICSSMQAHAQVKAIDKLEILYDQEHYAMVYRQANRLLDKPDYDYSVQPEFYKSLAMFQLARKDFWFRMHPNALQDARKLFLEVKSSSDGMKVFNAHIDHVMRLRRSLAEWAVTLKREGDQDKYDQLQQILFGLFDQVPELDNPGNYVPPALPEDNEIAESVGVRKKRDQIADYAKRQIGVPYAWAGTDPSGFDCSGFTTYVMKEFNKKLPRRAEEQYNASRKVRQRSAQKGDLVFFNNGSGISHVGIIVSEKGQPLVMVHASSSKGIMVTEIETSEYWLKRLYAFGSYVD